LPRVWRRSQPPRAGRSLKLTERFVSQVCGLGGYHNFSSCGIFEVTHVRANSYSTQVGAAAAGLRELARSWNESRRRRFDRDGCPFMGGNSRSSAVHSRHSGARRHRGRFAVSSAQSRIVRARSWRFLSVENACVSFTGL
jgi:hypothetical protein